MTPPKPRDATTSPSGAAPPKGATVLVVEDETAIAAAVAARLRSEGYTAEVAHDGPTAVARCEEMVPDLVVLDLMLPGIDGLEVCRRIQAQRPVPVLMLTAKDSETDKIVGLGVGADDYVTKPFSTRELVARVGAILRRVERSATDGGGPEPRVRIGALELDRESRRVHRDGTEIHLTPTEFDLLAVLAERPERVYSRRELLADVWGYPEGTGERTVDSHVRALRAKVGADVVRTVHGVGYALAEPEPEPEPGSGSGSEDDATPDVAP
ncbi:MAG: response regulator transcription factor [Acidimicrobiia bacterium]